MTEQADRHGWIGTGTVATKLGGVFDFENSWSVSPERSRDALVYCRAVEAFLLHVPTVAQWWVWKGPSAAAAQLQRAARSVLREDVEGE
jgi:hypothetical protein